MTFALPLREMAVAFGGVEGRVADGMRAYPELIRGPKALDTNLMQAFPGWIAKGGAEGLICAASPAGLAVALKVEDGTQRALAPRARIVPGHVGPRRLRLRQLAHSQQPKRSRRRIAKLLKKVLHKAVDRC